MSSFYDNVEAALKSQQPVYLINLIYYHGVNCFFALPRDDVYTDVYGPEYSGDIEDYSQSFKAIVNVDEYDSQFGGGILYTHMNDPLPIGTTIKVDRPDLRNRRYSIHNYKNFGLGNRVFRRYLINSVGD